METPITKPVSRRDSSSDNLLSGTGTDLEIIRFSVPKGDYHFLNKELSIHAISRVGISLVSQRVN